SKLKPPKWPVTTRTSPTKYRPFCCLLSMVLADTSVVSTTPKETPPVRQPSVHDGFNSKTGIHLALRSSLPSLRVPIGVSSTSAQTRFCSSITTLFGRCSLNKVRSKTLGCPCFLRLKKLIKSILGKKLTLKLWPTSQ